MSLDRIPAEWLTLGFLGQAMFTARFLVQWLASERRKRSVVPVMFWWLSVAGGLLLLAYALKRGDPVFIVGQSAGLLVYSRNLVLIRRQRVTAPAPPVPAERNTPSA